MGEEKLTPEKIREYNEKVKKNKPSQNVNNHWVHAFSPWHEEGLDTSYVGKWCIFGSPKQLDKYWPKLINLIQKHEEIKSMKVRTSALNWHEFFMSGFDVDGKDAIKKVEEEAKVSKKPRVICVYVKDYRDKDLLKKVRDLIRSIGVKSKIKFKTDQATKDRIYTGDEREFLHVDSIKEPLE